MAKIANAFRLSNPSTTLSTFWKILPPLRNSAKVLPNNKFPDQIYYFDEEDAFKKRGAAFENEYIRKLTQELINELKKKIQKERAASVREVLEGEKKKLVKELNKLEEEAEKGDKK